MKVWISVSEVESTGPSDVSGRERQEPGWLCGGADLSREIQKFMSDNLILSG